MEERAGERERESRVRSKRGRDRRTKGAARGEVTETERDGREKKVERKGRRKERTGLRGLPRGRVLRLLRDGVRVSAHATSTVPRPLDCRA